MLLKTITKIRDEEKGEGSVEYGLFIAIIAIIVIGILIALNGEGQNIYDNLSGSFKNSGK